MMNVVRSLKIITTALAIVLLVSCSAKKGTTSSVSIVLPSAQSSNKAFSNSVSAMSFNFSVACFAINVTGLGIPQSPNSCSPAVGVFSGFKPSGSTVVMEVPIGSARQLEVFLFNRAVATDPCPADFSSLTPDKVSRVGLVSGIEMNQPETSVSVQVTAPAVGVNLMTQNIVPNSCVAPVASAGPGAQRLVLGAKKSSTGGGYTIDGQVTSIRTMNEISSPAGYKMLIGPKGL